MPTETPKIRKANLLPTEDPCNTLKIEDYQKLLDNHSIEKNIMTGSFPDMANAFFEKYPPIEAVIMKDFDFIVDCINGGDCSSQYLSVEIKNNNLACELKDINNMLIRDVKCEYPIALFKAFLLQFMAIPNFEKSMCKFLFSKGLCQYNAAPTPIETITVTLEYNDNTIGHYDISNPPN